MLDVIAMGEQMRVERLAHGFRYKKDLAESIGTDPEMIANYEYGRSVVLVENLGRLCRVMAGDDWMATLLRILRAGGAS